MSGGMIYIPLLSYDVIEIPPEEGGFPYSYEWEASFSR
jgi:hypothetical protein